MYRDGFGTKYTYWALYVDSVPGMSQTGWDEPDFPVQIVRTSLYVGSGSVGSGTSSTCAILVLIFA